MQIGTVYTQNKSLMMEISLPFMNPQKFLLLLVKEKTKENSPDFNVIHRLAIGKSVSVGGIWNKTSEKGVQYKSLTIEHPLMFKGKLNGAIFQMEKAETIKDDQGDKVLSHSVNWSAPRPREQNNAFNNQGNYQAPIVENNNNYQVPTEEQYNQQSSQEQNIPSIDVDDSEIPF